MTLHPTMIARPFVRCLFCEGAIEFGPPTGMPVEALPDPFVARCGHCRSQQLFAKGDIETAEASAVAARAFGP